MMVIMMIVMMMMSVMVIDMAIMKLSSSLAKCKAGQHAVNIEDDLYMSSGSL